MIKKTTAIFSFCFVLLGGLSFSQSKTIGTTQNFIHKISSSNDKGEHAILLEVSTGKKVNVQFDEFYRGNNKISATGNVEGYKNSFALMKVNGSAVYGYIVYDKKAYKYINQGSLIRVEAAKVSDFFNDLESDELYHHHEDHDGDEVNRRVEKMMNKESDETHNTSHERFSLPQYPHLDNYTEGTDVTKLQSLPGSQYVIYIDLRDVFNGNTPKHVSKEVIYGAWKGTATAYVAFDVNITTDSNVYNAVPVTNSCIAKLLDERGRSFAPLNSFGTKRYSHIFRDNTAWGYASTLIHEVGHQLGLSHDGGQPGGEYYEGIQPFSWNSYMGNYNFTILNQWSHGEYKGANNFEDDLGLITGHIPYRADDNSSSTPLQFEEGTATVPVELNVGSIERNTDEDVHTFSLTEAGIVSLKIEPIEYLTLLDVDARIEDENGNIIAQSNVSLKRHAEFKNVLVENAGNYKLIIKGGAEGTPQDGFSNYSSLGVYGISGWVRELPEFNLTIMDVNKFSEACNATTPSVRIKNLGLKAIENIEFTVTIDGGAEETVNVTGLNIPSLEETNISLPEVTTIGRDLDYKVKGIKVNGTRPLGVEEQSISYTLGEGEEIELAISTPTASLLGWSVMKDGVKIADEQNTITVINDGGYEKSKFCIVEDCYSLEVKYIHDNCSVHGNSIRQWSGAQGYPAGTIVKYNGGTYEAKWWAEAWNTPGNGDPWKYLGTCEVTQGGDFTLTTTSDNNTLIRENIEPSDNLSLNFCPAITSTTSISKENEGLVYKPNPFHNYLTIEVEDDEIQEVLIYNTSGNNVMSKTSVLSKTIQLGDDLLSGVYTVKVRGAKKSYNFKVVKL